MYLKDIEDKQQNIINLESSIHEKLEVIISKDREIDEITVKNKQDREITEEKYNKKILEFNHKLDDYQEKLKNYENNSTAISSEEKINLSQQNKNTNTNINLSKNTNESESDKIEFIKGTFRDYVESMKNNLIDYKY